MRIIQDVQYSKSDAAINRLDIYLPDTDCFPVFVYFHGGGLESGDKGAHIFIKDLLAQDIAVVSANYRMYPEAVFPEYLCDAAEAVSWVFDNINLYGKCTDLFIGGSSAGGYITQMLCFDGKYLSEYGINADSISGYFMDAGQATVHYNILRERGLDARRIIVDEAAPLFHVCGERAYPPMEIIVSDNDMENRFEQTTLLASTLRHFGHKPELRVISNSTHCSYLEWTDDNKNSFFAKLIHDFIAGSS